MPKLLGDYDNIPSVVKQYLGIISIQINHIRKDMHAIRLHT